MFIYLFLFYFGLFYLSFIILRIQSLWWMVVWRWNKRWLRFLVIFHLLYKRGKIYFKRPTCLKMLSTQFWWYRNHVELDAIVCVCVLDSIRFLGLIQATWCTNGFIHKRFISATTILMYFLSSWIHSLQHNESRSWMLHDRMITFA